LYALERGFIYVHKPTVHIRFDEILSVNFARSTGTTRSFDFEVETRSGVVHNFSSIEKEEYAKLFDFAHTKKLRIKNRGKDAGDEQVDDDMIGSDEDDEADPYLHRVTQEGRQRVEDDSDESDEDFAPDAASSDGDSPAEEYDSDAASSSEEGDDDDESSKKKKKHKEKKKEKKSKKEKSKKNKDGKPKKPMSAYFLWLNENRESLKKKYPDLSLTELTKKAGEIWREKLPDKSKWEKMAADSKKKYDEEMSALGISSKSSKGSGDSKKKTVASPQKRVISKEFVEDSDSSDSDAAKSKPSSSKSDDKKESDKKEKKEKKKKKEESESSEEEASESESEDDSDDASDDDDDD